jgi:transcriptional regulator with XRE-family HTH domain
MTGDEVRAIRRKLRLNQQQLAKLCGLRQDWVSQVECGKSPVPAYMQTILRLAQHTSTGLDACLEAVNAAD